MKTLKILKRFCKLKWEEFCDFFSNFVEHFNNDHGGAIFIMASVIITIVMGICFLLLLNETASKWVGIIFGCLMGLLVIGVGLFSFYLFFEWFIKLIISNYKEAKRQIEAETKKKRRVIK